LDGKAFYAARTAGNQDERLLFGWVSHKQGRSDTGVSIWGGDLMVHQLHKMDDGQLAVSLPEKYRTGLSAAQAADIVWTRGAVAGAEESVTLAANSAFTLASSTQKNRLAFSVKSENEHAQFGIELRNPATNQRVVIAVDAANDLAKYYREGDAANPDNPVVAVPLDITEGINIEVLLDSQAGVGAVYFNNYRALSFRLYGLPEYEVGVYSGADAIAVTDLERFTR
jgi:hypothetical protein